MNKFYVADCMSKNEILETTETLTEAQMKDGYLGYYNIRGPFASKDEAEQFIKNITPVTDKSLLENLGGEGLDGDITAIEDPLDEDIGVQFDPEDSLAN